MPGDMMPISEIRRRSGLMYPPAQQFIERFAGVDADDVFVYDVVSGEMAVPVDVARTAIENYEAERAEGIAAQAEYDRYRKQQVEKARQERIAANAKAAEVNQKRLAESSKAYSKAVSESALQATGPVNERMKQYKKVQVELAGSPLSFDDWQKKIRRKKR